MRASSKAIAFRHAGLPCKIMKNDLGAWCGYVRVPRGRLYDLIRRRMKHRERARLSMLRTIWGGKWMPTQGYTLKDLGNVTVHGGLTFCGRIGERGRVWLGFDCAHAGDLVPGIVTALAQVSKMPPSGVYRAQPYVDEQTRRLAVQIAALALDMETRA